MSGKIYLGIIIVLAIVGVADSLYALNQHYAPAGGSACDVNETVSCTAVNQSEYSEMFGIPIAGMGAAGYLLMAGLSAAVLARLAGRRTALPVLLGAAIVALGFSLWLTYVELFILNTVCPLCVLSLTLVTLITALSITVSLKGWRA